METAGSHERAGRWCITAGLTPSNLAFSLSLCLYESRFRSMMISPLSFKGRLTNAAILWKER
jgi:hypothetical protein